MNLQNSYKVVYEEAAGGKRTFYASKSEVYPVADDVELASFNDADFVGKTVFEKDGKFYISVGNIPAYNENGEPVGTTVEGFEEIFIETPVNSGNNNRPSSDSNINTQEPHTGAITTNVDSYGELNVNENIVTLKATGTVGWKKSAWGTYGNWVGFRISVPEGVDAATAVYTRPNGKSSKLSEVLDSGKNYASVYYDMSKRTTATYYLDWNGDGINDLTVIIDVSDATLVAGE